MKKTLLFLSIAAITACSNVDQVKDSEHPTNEGFIAAEEQDSTALQPKKVKTELIKRRPRLSQEAYAYKAINTASLVTMPLSESNRENYNHFEDNGVQITKQNPVSTFSIDVDTGAYSNMRRMLNQGIMPAKDSIRVEELINYFSYQYALPDNKEQPFSINTEMAPSPWNNQAKLLHIGIQGFKAENKTLPASNLTFLIDVSGSMNSPSKLGLLKSSFKLMANNMRAQDRISIVVYAGAAGAVLEPTAGNEKAKIMQALDKLTAGGSTNGSAGIQLAYQLNEDNFIKQGINRVIIATDGDFNVGTTNFEQLKELVERKRNKGIALTTLGFGRGNYNDHLMEQLADVGNGNYAYIDTLKEANKVLVNEMSSTLMTIAKDVKIQIEFNPNTVSQYRLIGYENRLLKTEDFNNDKIDAGEIGAGHTVTALYEIVLSGQKGWVESLKYKNQHDQVSYSDELATLKVRYKQPTSLTSQLLVKTIKTSEILADIQSSSINFKLATAVAGYGQLLRGGQMTQKFSYNDVAALTKATLADDEYGYRGEFLQLVSLAKSLRTSQ